MMRRDEGLALHSIVRWTHQPPSPSTSCWAQARRALGATHPGPLLCARRCHRNAVLVVAEPQCSVPHSTGCRFDAATCRPCSAHTWLALACIESWAKVPRVLSRCSAQNDATERVTGCGLNPCANWLERGRMLSGFLAEEPATVGSALQASGEAPIAAK